MGYKKAAHMNHICITNKRKIRETKKHFKDVSIK